MLGPRCGDRKSVAQCRPSVWQSGVEWGCEAGYRNEEDGFVGVVRRKGDLKSWTLIGGDEALASLWWHSVPDICLTLNNTLDRTLEWWPPGRLTLQPVPRWVTSGHFLPLCLPLHLSMSLSFCLGPVNTHPLVWWVLPKLTADMLVSLFPPAILLELASVISHAADKQLRPQHLSNPPFATPHDSVSLQRKSGEKALFYSKNCGWLSFLDIRRYYLSLCKI